jgi:hypothetical protein
MAANGGFMTSGGSDGMIPVVPALPPAAPTPTRWSQWTLPDRNKQHYSAGTATTFAMPPGFLSIGHSLFSLLFGMMGGLLAARYRRESGARIGEQAG